LRINEAFRTHLIGDSGVSAIVGARIYAGLAAQTKADDTFQPTIVFREVPAADTRSITGTVLKEVRYAIISMAANYDTAHDLAEAAALALDGFRGVMGGVGGINVAACRVVVGKSDEPDAELNIHAVMQTFSISYQPS
jgi:hypothetical protein